MKNFDSAPRPLIYLITKGDATIADYDAKKRETLRLIEIAVANKIPLIQIREKQLPARLLFDLARAAALITADSATKLLVNDRADVALAAKADGVHLTGKSLAVKVIRRHFPENFIVGVSAHTSAEVFAAKKQKADFAVYSPIFSTPDKGAPLGLDALRRICEQAKPFPVIGLGGANETNYESILEIADGFAAIRFLNDAENLRKLYRDIRRK